MLGAINATPISSVEYLALKGWLAGRYLKKKKKKKERRWCCT
jgi:hypothetical protein